MPWVWSDDFKDLLGEHHPPLDRQLLSLWSEHPVGYAVAEDQDVADFVERLMRTMSEDQQRR